MPVSGPDPQKLTVNTSLVGTWQTTADQAGVTRVTFEVENMTAFLAPWPRNAQPPLSEGPAVSVVTFDERAAFTFEEFEVTVGLQTVDRATHRTRASQTVGTTQVAQINITSPTPRPFRDFDRISKPFIDFATFVADQKSALVLYTGQDAEGQSFEVIEQLVAAPDPARPPQNQYRYLFRAADVDLSTTLSAWLWVWHQTEPAISLMLAARYRSGYVEFDALALAVCAETLHKKLKPGARVRGEPGFTEAKERILGAIQTSVDAGVCEDNDREWVDSNLRDDLSFPKRARDLALMADPEKSPRVVPDVRSWVRALTKARNGFAHGSSTGVDDALRLLMERTRWLLAIVVMQHIGVPGHLQIPEEGALQYLDTLAQRVAESRPGWKPTSPWELPTQTPGDAEAPGEDPTSQS